MTGPTKAEIEQDAVNRGLNIPFAIILVRNLKKPTERSNHERSKLLASTFCWSSFDRFGSKQINQTQI